MARLALMLLRWGTPLGLLAVALFLRHPFLFSVRTGATLAVELAGLSGLAIVLLRRPWRRPVTGMLLTLLWLAGPAAAFGERVRFDEQRQAVVAASGPEAREVGRHFMIGYADIAMVKPLAAAGLIGGIFVTRRNIDGRNLEDLRREIADLQELRRTAGLPLLLVATDQEGGIVSRLSPPLTALPPLSRFAPKPAAERERLAEEQGAVQGRELAALGVTVDFSPVVDLREPDVAGLLDLHSRIADRAISDDPAVVADIAAAYARGLARYGVLPTLKHFPGLGRIAQDTHLFAARLDLAPAELARQDWLPFRRVLAEVPAALMIGHITLTGLDPAHQASQSPAVVQGLLRRDWGFHGLIVTDDFSMGAVYNHGLCASVIRALNAGVDVLLISYDEDQYYPAMACALDARRDGRLDKRILGRSSLAGTSADKAS